MPQRQITYNLFAPTTTTITSNTFKLNSQRAAPAPSTAGNKPVPRLDWPAIIHDDNPTPSSSPSNTHFYLKEFNLAASGSNIEIWEAKYLKFPLNNDCRNQIVQNNLSPGATLYDHIIQEFDSKIYPVLVEDLLFFQGGEGSSILPTDKNGNQTVDLTSTECTPWTPDICNSMYTTDGNDGFGTTVHPGDYYAGTANKIVVLVDNIRDGHYNFDSVSGTSSPTAESMVYYKGGTEEFLLKYTHRLVTTLDVFDWEHRTTDNPPTELSNSFQSCANDDLGDPNAFLTRPYDVEGTLGHELYHLLSYYSNFEFKDDWIENGLADYYGRYKLGYVDLTLGVEEDAFYWDLKVFLGFATDGNGGAVEFLGGPEQSLNMWGDWSGLALPADYGISLAFLLYLQDRINLYNPRFNDADQTNVTMEVLHCCAQDIAYFHKIFVPTALNNLLDVAGVLLTPGEDSQTNNNNDNAGFRTVMNNFFISLAVTAEITQGGATVTGRFLAQDGSTTSSLSAENVTMISMPYSKINWDTTTAYANPGAPPNGADFVRLRNEVGNFLSADQITEITFENASKGPTLPLKWYLGGNADNESFLYTPDNLYSYENGITRELTITGEGIIEIDMEYDIELFLSYFYVMVYDEVTEQFVYLKTDNDWNCYDMNIKPCITGHSYGRRTHSFDASDFLGENAQLTLMYKTADQGPSSYSGIKVYGIKIDGTAVHDALHMDLWKSFTESYPPVLGWHVSLIAYTPAEGDLIWISELPLDGNQEGNVTDFTEPSLVELIGNSDSVVAAIVSLIDETGKYNEYFTYDLRVNGVLQPGGS